MLTDFQDAPEEILPEDKSLLQRARAGVEMLNAKYQSDRPNIFFLFHRPRRWNEAEGLWMGYERKRGKLTEFNALLRGGSSECFSEIVGDTSILPAIKFVITLDTDTQLPRDAARQLVGTMAHPLNRPQFDPVKGVVTEGYSILQPRVGVSLPSAGRSWFVQLFAGDVGIDPYTRAVSDVYQDVFQEGSFIGKGIYDVDAFQQAVAGRFPENTVLSHDLIEACHARSALVSDVELYEEYPSRYNTDIDRRHRWIRGDWQIAQWLLPRVPGPDARRIANPLSGLSQWKILDNLRRSLVPAALLLLLLGNWMLLPDLGGLGPLLVLCDHHAAGIVVGGWSNCSASRGKCRWRCICGGWSARPDASSARSFSPSCSCPTTPSSAWMPSAGRWCACWLLANGSWNGKPPAIPNAPPAADLAGFYATMWIAPVVALACGSFLALTQPAQLPLAAADPGPLVGCSLDRLADQPAHRASAVPELTAEAIGLPSANGAQDLALF